MTMEKEATNRRMVIYQVNCRLCGEKLQAPTSEELKQKLHDHIDKECKAAQRMRGWEKDGIFKDMMHVLRDQALSDALEKLVKKYSLEEVKDALETIELEKS